MAHSYGITTNTQHLTISHKWTLKLLRNHLHVHCMLLKVWQGKGFLLEVVVTVQIYLFVEWPTMNVTLLQNTKQYKSSFLHPKQLWMEQFYHVGKTDMCYRQFLMENNFLRLIKKWIMKAVKARLWWGLQSWRKDNDEKKSERVTKVCRTLFIYLFSKYCTLLKKPNSQHNDKDVSSVSEKTNVNIANSMMAECLPWTGDIYSTGKGILCSYGFHRFTTVSTKFHYWTLSWTS